VDLNKFLRNTILAGIWLIPFIPLYVANSMFFPFITGKNFAFRIIVEIIFALWIVLALRDRSYAPNKSAILYSILTFMAVLTVADIFGANLFRSLWSNFERMEGLVALLHLLGYFLVIGSVLNTEGLWNRYLKTILAVGVLIVFYALAQMAGFFTINQGGFRVDATFGNAIYLAVHMLFLSFISAFYFFRTRLQSENGLEKWTYPILAVVYLFVLYNTQTRGAIIGLVAGVGVMLAILVYRGDERVRKFSGRALILAALLLLLFIPARNLKFFKESPTLGRFTEINFQNIAKEPRLMVWGMALRGFKEHPILGWGQDNFNLVFNKYYVPQMYSQEPWFDRAHDVFFDWLSAGGIFGLLSYLSIFAAALYTIWERSERLSFTLSDKAIFTGLIVAYFVQNIFVFDNLISYTMFFTLLAYLHFGSRINAPLGRKVVSPSSDDTLFIQSVSSIVLVGLVLSIYFVNIKPILTSRYLIKMLSSQDLKQGLDYFKKAVSYKSLGIAEAREQLAQRAVNLRGLNVGDNLKLEYFNLARDEMLKQIDSSPLDARYRVFLATVFNNYGLLDEALVQSEKAVALSPNKQSLIFELVATHLNRGEFDKALELAKHAYDLEPNWSESRRIYAAVAIYAKKDSVPEVAKIISELAAVGSLDYQKLAAPYAFVNRHDKILEIWKKRVELNPDNSDFHTALASSYLGVGERAKAVEELRIAIKLNPAFKETGEKYISEILAGKNP